MKRLRALALGAAGLAVLVSAAPAAARAIESPGGIAITDYDGHAHNTSPKRVGQHANLWCRSVTDDDQKLSVTVYHEARALTTRAVTCPADDFPRRHQMIRLRHRGTYSMVLSGGGLEGFVIRTRVVKGEPKPPDDLVPCEVCGEGPDQTQD